MTHTEQLEAEIAHYEVVFRQLVTALKSKPRECQPQPELERAERTLRGE